MNYLGMSVEELIREQKKVKAEYELLKSKNLIGFRLKTAKIKSVKAKTANKIIAPYFKKVIKSPNIIVMI